METEMYLGVKTRRSRSAVRFETASPATLVPVTSGEIIREARLRAKLSQGDLATRIDRTRSQVARWERDEVTPSLDTLRWIVRACGYDFDVRLFPYEPPDDAPIEETVELTPAERVQRALDLYRAQGLLRG